MTINFEDPVIQELTKSISEDPKGFVAITGAGISRPSGIPSWKDLRDRVLSAVRDRAFSLDEDERKLIIRQTKDLESHCDYWHVFEHCENTISKNIFQSTIKEILSTQGRKIPTCCELLWKCGINGILTYNLDDFSEQAYSKSKNMAVTSFSNNQPSYFNILSDGVDFVYHIHGKLIDHESWVLTDTQKRNLYDKNENFINFNNKIWSTKKTLTIGFDVSDISFELMLNQLERRNTFGNKNFIVFPNNKKSEIDRLTRIGFKVIPYTPSNEKHPEIEELLRYLINFKPEQKYFTSVLNNTSEEETLEDPRTLKILAIDDINSCRKKLNNKLKKIINNEQDSIDTKKEKMRDFNSQYNGAIRMCWDIGTDEDNSILFNYQIIEKLGKGAFGHVYKAKDKRTDEHIAIKVLMEDVRKEFDFSNCFRRGVKSMSILKENNIGGMVGIKEAFEIPSCIVMDFIDGITLREGIDKRFLDFNAAADILYKTAKSINEAHSLKEQVLHRDLKPENIIISEYFTNPENPDVKVLDFDLSWHKGATEGPIIQDVLAKGFAAPEQLSDKAILKELRNTAVDTFGMGMVCYFALTGNTPIPNQHRFENFRNETENLIRKRYTSKIKSLPVFAADTIYLSTLDDQSIRIPFDALLDRLCIINKCLETEKISSTHPLFALEIAYQIETNPHKIAIKENGKHITINSADESKNIDIQIGDNFGKAVARLKISKIRGPADNRNLKKYLPTAKEKTKTALTSFGFKGVECQIIDGGLEVSGHYELGENFDIETIKGIAYVISEARSKMELSNN
ncbi:protein kinase [Motiliproteus sp. SC1-56]|uniref:protein kinase domain-containing protein n=1 Tax=Motiliproteus sp. SC1-56 TaxID=2799565 RepID=UPI001A8D918B|nr:protein kinase [Motiliproteus sp. SC1-56]